MKITKLQIEVATNGKYCYLAQREDAVYFCEYLSTFRGRCFLFDLDLNREINYETGKKRYLRCGKCTSYEWPKKIRKEHDK